MRRPWPKAARAASRSLQRGTQVPAVASSIASRSVSAPMTARRFGESGRSTNRQAPSTWVPSVLHRSVDGRTRKSFTFPGRAEGPPRDGSPRAPAAFVDPEGFRRRIAAEKATRERLRAAEGATVTLSTRVAAQR